MTQRSRLLAVFLICTPIMLFTVNCGETSRLESASLGQFRAPSAEENSPLQVRSATAEDRIRAYRRASLIFLKSLPTSDKIEQVRSESGYNTAIDELLASEQLISTLREYHQQFFELEGVSGDINYNEPANLAAYLIREDLDFRDILRANYCVNDDLEQIPCSSFNGNVNLTNENAAGAVTTRGFMQKWNSPFAFRRTEHMLKAFACQSYPDESDPGLTEAEISTTQHNFSCTTGCTPQCYSCHRTMNSRASLFYTFDLSGRYNLNPPNNLAIKTDTDQRSTVADLLAPDVVPRYQMRNVEKLKDYALALSNHDKFRSCLAKRVTQFSLGGTLSNDLPPELKDVDLMLTQSGFKLKTFLSDLLRSNAYVIQ